VLEYCGATLKKEHQQADFSVRPLPAELRDYIADDVRYLVEVGRLVREACVKADILEEVLLDCERMCEDATVRPDPLANFSPKLPRGELKGDRLVLAWQISQRLNQLRHVWAEAEDVPVGRMLSNMAVVAVATRLPENQRELAKAAGVRGAFVRTHGDEVLSVVRELRARLASGTLEPMPERTRELDPRKKRRDEALMNWRKLKAAERKVTPSVILPNLLVDDLARLNPRGRDELAAVPWFGPKRLELYGAQVLDVLESASR
jgi:ribonuclease D